MMAGFGLSVPVQSIRQFGVPHHGTAISRAPNPTLNGFICDPSAQKCNRNDSKKTSFELEFIACTPGLIAKHSRTGARSCSYSSKDFITFSVIGRLAPEIPPTGFGSCFLEAITSVSELSGIHVEVRNSGSISGHAIWLIRRCLCPD